MRTAAEKLRPRTKATESQGERLELRLPCLAERQNQRRLHSKAEGQAGRMGLKLMAVVAEGAKAAIYLSPTAEHEEIRASESWKPSRMKFRHQLTMRMLVFLYGMTWIDHSFSLRANLVGLTTFSDLVGEARVDQ